MDEKTYRREVERARKDAKEAAERVMGSAARALSVIEAAKQRLEKPKKRWWQFWKR